MRRATTNGAILGLVAAAAAGGALASAAPAPGPVVTTDPKGDVRSTLDVTRVSVARSADGRVRASITLAAAWDGKALRNADGGTPGSICLKAWTTTQPPDTTPQYLVCATADKAGALRGSVLEERANRLPVRRAGADVSRPSARTVTLRFSQTAIGRPAMVALAAESTRPGCARATCIDLAPDAPKTLTLKLRAGTT